MPQERFMPQKFNVKTINWKRTLIWVGSILAFLIVILFAGGIILQDKLPSRLKNAVHTGSRGIYQLDFDDMDVSLLSGAVRIKNLKLIPDTAVYAQSADKDASSNLFRLKSSSLRISGVSVLRLLFNKNLRASNITLDRPEVLVMNMLDTVKVDTAEKKSLYQQLPDFLQDAELGVVRINDLSYVQQEKGDTSKRGGRWNGLSFSFESVVLDSTSHRDSSTFWFCKDIKVDSRKVGFSSGDGMYTFDIGAIKSSMKAGDLVVSDFKVVPQYPELEFSKRLGEQGDRYNFVFNEISAKGIDFKTLETVGKLNIAGLNLADAELRIFNNKALPSSGKIVTENFPHIAMKSLGIPLNLDTLSLKNLAVYYKELNPNSGKSGTVFFTQLYGTLHNVTNDTAQWQSDPWCRSIFKTNFMGKVPLNVSINFLMPDKDGAFNYEGTLGKSDAKLFNPLLEPLALAKVEDGDIQKLSFSVKANRFGSTADVQMLYTDLKVNLLKKDGSVLKKKGFLSFLANAFIVKNSNPRKKGEEPLRAHVTHVHPQDRSFFNLMWKSIFTGIKDNLGVPEL